MDLVRKIMDGIGVEIEMLIEQKVKVVWVEQNYLGFQSQLDVVEMKDPFLRQGCSDASICIL